MAFQRLNIRAKKSFAGLCSFDNVESSSPKSTAVHIESSPRSGLTQDTEECDLEDFGVKLERCKGKDIASKDSPTKRKKLFGSLRSLRSLANLHPSPTKTKQSMTSRSESPVKHQDTCTPRLPVSPSLALLNFEQSPSDKPMFDLTIHQHSVSGSSVEVHHSSPMTVPSSARQATPYNLFPPATDLPAGTIPDTPGPMQRAFNHDPANHVPWQNASPTPMEKYAPSTPVLTPLPGTNLSVGDIDPEFVLLPPSINPSTAHLGRSTPGYFDIPVHEYPQVDGTNVLNGLACLKLADDHGGTSSDHSRVFNNPSADAPIGRHGTAEEMRHQYEDAKLQDTVTTLDIPQDLIRAHRHQQQAGALQENVRALGVSAHHQHSPLHLKRQTEGLQDPARKDSCMSEDWKTYSGERSTAMTSEHSLHNCNLNQPYTSSALSVSSVVLPPVEGKRADNGNKSPLNFAYIVWDSPSGPRKKPAPENTWGRHTGLYDGTGYGDNSGPSTPGEPDESNWGRNTGLCQRTGYGPDGSGPSTHRKPNKDAQDGHLKASSAPLSVSGARSGNENCSQPPRIEDSYHETERESPFTAHEQGSCDSLVSIYRAYAFPLGDRIPSSSNSAGGDVLRPATNEDEIKS